jgi:hypothetical protein
MRSRPAIALAVLVLTMISATAVAAAPPVTLPVPHVFTGLVVDPSPVPTPAEGRVPVGLRLTNTIWTDEGQLPATTETRFELDRGFRFDMSRVATCRNQGGRDVRTEESRCEVGEVGSGRIQFQVTFPGGEPAKARGPAVAHKIGPRKVMIQAWLSAPAVGEVRIPLEIERTDAGGYGLSATASIPKVAGGYGSLDYLGLRFRRGLFSLTCGKRGRIQSSVTNTFADGTASSATLLTEC